MVRHLGVLLLAACGSGSKAAAPPAVAHQTTGPACIADRLGEPVDVKLPRCDGDALEACRVACAADDLGACVSIAYDLDPDPARHAEAVAIYERACLGGVATACTNYGAHLLFGERSSPDDQACAHRVHRWSCEAWDAWGCGMVGRELLEGMGVAADPAAARTLLERACDSFGSFPCQVLADAMVDGVYGDPHRDQVVRLYQRACDTGAPEACTKLERLGQQ